MLQATAESKHRAAQRGTGASSLEFRVFSTDAAIVIEMRSLSSPSSCVWLLGRIRQGARRQHVGGSVHRPITATSRIDDRRHQHQRGHGAATTRRPAHTSPVRPASMVNAVEQRSSPLPSAGAPAPALAGGRRSVVYAQRFCDLLHDRARLRVGVASDAEAPIGPLQGSSAPRRRPLPLARGSTRLR